MSNDVTTEVVDGRRSVYGEPSISFPLVAQVWSGILGTEVRPDQVPLLLIGYKLVRASECPEYSDNIDDVDGYAKIFREVMGDRLISARSVTEFLEKKEQRERQVPSFMRKEHADPCWMWNQSWDRSKWPFTCVCRLTPNQVGAISAERTETEAATPNVSDEKVAGMRAPVIERDSGHTWSNNHGRSANPSDIHSRQCFKHNERIDPEHGPWTCICREACRLDHPLEKANQR